MSASAVVFYILSVVILGAALLAVTSRKIFRSAIWLLFSLTGIAGLYFWLQMEFVAAVQIVVYVGGIVVLIIFSIFLTQQSGMDLPPPAGVCGVCRLSPIPAAPPRPRPARFPPRRGPHRPRAEVRSRHLPAPSWPR